MSGPPARTRQPGLRRAIVTEVAAEEGTARVLVEYQRLVPRRDGGVLQGEPEPDTRGVEARALPGVEVGDEVLVDLRPLPVIWLSFLYFVAPLLLAGLLVLVTRLAGQAYGMTTLFRLLLQLAAGGGGMLLGYRFAEIQRQRLQSAGAGCPVITAILPRLMDEGGDPEDPRDAYLLSRFPLTAPPRPEDWEFAREELGRVVGVRSVTLLRDRVEVVFHGRQLKERHLLELLLTFSLPVELDRDLVD